MRYLIANLAALILGALPLWAECRVPDPTAAVAGWTVQQVNGEWVARNPGFSNVQAALFMHAPERPQILDWTIPERYQGRIGVLQHYAGAPGTSYLAVIISSVVIDLQTGAVLGEASFSEDCEIMAWHWHDDKVVIEDTSHGEVIIRLP